MVFFGSSMRHNPKADHVLFTNVIPPELDGFDAHAWLLRHGVRIVNLKIGHRLTTGSVNSWGNQFYILDIIQWAANDSDLQTLLVFDSDCIWIESAHAIEDAVRREGILTYELWYDQDEIVNGMSRRMMAEVYERLLGERPRGVPAYCGGEFFAATKPEIQKLAAKLSDLWERNNKAAQEEGSLFCMEEAQLLSLLYHKLCYCDGTANPFIKRLWTGRGFNNSDHKDKELTVWHLPAEKRFGHRDVFKEVRQEASHFWSVPIGTEFTDYVDKAFGVFNKPWTMRLRNLRIRVSDRILEFWER